MFSAVVKASALSDSLTPGAHYDKTLTYQCGDCVVEDILCKGESVLSGGRITVTPQSKTVNLNYPSFEDEYACVYMAVFNVGDQKYLKHLAIIDNASVQFPSVEKDKPQDGSVYVKEITFVCEGDCSIEKITVNQISLQTQPPSTRRNSNGGAAHAYFTVEGDVLTITIPNFSFLYEGVYQVVVLTPIGQVTKTILHLGDLEVENKGKSNAAIVATTASDAPASDAPSSDAPASEAPASDAPASEAPASDAPASDASADDVTTDSSTAQEDETKDPPAEDADKPE